jgi:putative transposase
MLRTYKFRLYPTKEQREKIIFTLERCRLLYNRLLDERICAYKQEGQLLTFYQQKATLPERKKAIPALKEAYSQVLQNVVERLDKAYQAFFRRVQAGEKAGFPRFKGLNRYDSFTYPQSGFFLEGKFLKLSKVRMCESNNIGKLKGRSRLVPSTRRMANTMLAFPVKSKQSR